MNIREDVWSRTEDEVLKKAVKKYGSNQWNRVASLISRKTAAQCRSRWYEVLDPNITHDEWTEEEDTILLELARRMPNMWRSIGATLGGRSAGQCHERFQALNNMELKEVDKPGGTEGELDEKAQQELISEADARLNTSLGRKAKRKKRERLESEEKFHEMLQRNKVKREHELVSLQINPPTVHQSAPIHTNAKHESRSFRPKLDLSPPTQTQASTNKLQSIPISAKAIAKLNEILDRMPNPIHK